MALDSLTARANTGSGTDALAGKSTLAGFVGAALLTTDDGAEVNEANPLPVSATIAGVDAGNPLPVTAELTNGGSALGTGNRLPVSAIVTNGGTEVGAGNPLPVTSTDLATIAGAVRAEDSAHSSGHTGIPALAMRQAADTTSTDTDGDYTLLKIDEEGRLKVSTKPASYPDITGSITAVQATIGTPVAGGTVEGDVSRASNIMAFCSGTFSTINCTFEGSIEATGDTNWFAIQAVRSNANTIETTTGNLSAQPAYAWEMSVNALKRVRVRATARTSGTQNWRFVQGAYATEPIPAAQISGTQPVSGSVTATLAAATVRAGFVAGAGIWYDDSSAALAGNATFTGTSRDATVTASATAFANAATYAKEVRACAESDVTGTLWLEVSRDNTNWRRIRSVATAAITGGGFAAELTYLPAWRYWRIGYTNGASAQARFTIGTVAVAA